MGEGLKQMFREVSSSRAEDEDELGESSPLSGGSGDDEAGDSSQNKAHADPLHEFSSLVSQLPIKRGLSKFYQGKSQSLSSFSDVRCVEDLAKKESQIVRRKMKPSRSYARGLDDDDDDDDDHNSSCYGTKSGGAFNNKGATKKGPMGSCASSVARTSSSGSSSSCYFARGKPPPIRMHKNM